jgi:5-methylcytosine-specific restriction endonuclease McrA
VVWRDFYNIKFSAGKSLREKLERFAEVVGVDNAERNMAEVFERALDLALEKKDPRRKLERRRKREAAMQRATGSAGVSPASSGVSPTGSAGVSPASSPEKVSTEEMKPPEQTVCRAAHAAGSRYIPSSVRERVLERACYQCEFTGTGGARCSARTGLEIDHLIPRREEGSVRRTCVHCVGLTICSLPLGNSGRSS